VEERLLPLTPFTHSFMQIQIRRGELEKMEFLKRKGSSLGRKTCPALIGSMEIWKMKFYVILGTKNE
jgi:hypothetical protein